MLALSVVFAHMVATGTQEVEAASTATGDGRYTVHEAMGPGEPVETSPIDVLYPGSDALGLPWFPPEIGSNATVYPLEYPAGSGTEVIYNRITSCELANAAGIGTTIPAETPLPCAEEILAAGDDAANPHAVYSSDKPNQELTGRSVDKELADRVVMEGFILIPSGTASISLSGTNRRLDTDDPVASAVSFFTAGGDDRSTLVHRGTKASTSASAFSIKVDLDVPQGVCAVPPALAFRIYLFDGHAAGAASIKWKVTATDPSAPGAIDTGGTFTNIDTAYLSSVSGYDNDLDDDGTADYLEADFDGDGISDWVEMGETLENQPVDSDGDGTPDCEDLDSDNDGNPDSTDANRTVPVAVDDAQTVVVGSSVTIADVTANDDYGTPGAGTDFVITDLGTGTAPLARYTLNEDGSFTFNSATGDDLNGPFTVDYRICHTVPDPAVCTDATITITAVDDGSPTAVDDPENATPDDLTAIDIDWDDNDSLIDGATLDSFDATSVGGGSVADNGNGTFRYTPLVGFAGVDTFTYTICDDDTPTPVCDTATVTVTVGLQPRIGVAKSIVLPITPNSDGTVTATYTVVAENLGNEDLAGVTLDDSLASFPSGATAELSSTDVTVNSTFDGDGDTLLAAPFTLAVGSNASLTVAVTFAADGAGAIANQVAATATGSTSTSTATDTSDSGSDPDSDGDSIADETGENDPTVFNAATDVSWTTSLTIDKAASHTVHVSGSTYATTFTVTATNAGTEPLTGVQLTDDISAMPDVTDVSIGSVAGPAGVGANPGFDGTTDKALLAAVTDLAPAESVEVELTVTYTATSAGSSINTAHAVGAGAVTGITQNPTDSVTISFEGGDLPLVLSLTAGKALESVVEQGDGSFLATYTVTVSNDGTEQAEATLTDDLAAVFPAGFAAQTTVSTGDLTRNTNYDGSTDTNLAPTTTLAPGEGGTVTYAVLFTPTDLDTITNTATLAFTGAISGIADTASGFADLTSTDLAIETTAGGVKGGSVPVSNPDGTFTTTWTVTIVNDGDEALESLQATDDLTGLGVPYAVSNLSAAGGLTVNPTFDGDTDKNLLTGIDVLGAGLTASVSFDLTWTPDPATHTPNAVTGVSNMATITGIGSITGTEVTIDTGSGTDPTNPVDPGTATPTPPPPASAVKHGTTPVSNNDGTFTTTWTITVANTGVEDLDDVQAVDDLTAMPAGYAVSNLTSPTLTVNPDFDGDADKNLLAGTDTLVVGDQTTVSFDVTFTPDSTDGVSNHATITGTAAVTGTAVSITTQQGTDPLTPTGPGPSTTPPVPVTALAGAVKNGSDPVDNGDGTFTVTWTITIANNGSDHLIDVQVTDDLTGMPAGYAVGALTATGDLTVNPAFDGSDDQNLLAGTDTLAIGARAEIRFDVVFTPAHTDGVVNQAVLTGTGAITGTELTIATNAGTDPTDLTVQPEVSLTNPPAIETGLAVSKDASEPVHNGDGTFTMTWTVYFRNIGNEAIERLQGTDDLSDWPTAYTITDLGAAGGLTVNQGFDGSSDQNLLTGTDTLAPAATASVHFDITWTPTSTAGGENQATGVGTGSVTGTEIVAPSKPGPDPNAPDVAPGITTGPAIPAEGQVGAAKDIGEIEDIGSGRFRATFVITVRNMGSESLTAVQVTDDLTDIGDDPIVIGLDSASLLVNLGYDGLTDTALLTGTDTLAVGEVATIELVVEWGAAASGSNSATVSGVGSVTGSRVTDRSTPGTDPDPDGDGDPSEAGPTSVRPPLTATLSAAKQAVGSTINDDNTIDVSYRITIRNDSNQPLAGVQISDDGSQVGDVVDGWIDGHSPNLTPKPDYDPRTGIDLLTGTDELAPGEHGWVLVRFRATINAGVVKNQARATGTGVYDSASTTELTRVGSLSGTGPEAPTPLTIDGGHLVSGIAWFDVDRDGVRDRGEPVLAGIEFRLEPLEGANGEDPWEPITVTTGADGRYTIGPVPDGTYRATVVLDRGVSLSVPNSGLDDGFDSDFDRNSRTSQIFILKDGRLQTSSQSGVTANEADCPGRYVCVIEQLDAAVFWLGGPAGEPNGTTGTLPSTGAGVRSPLLVGFISLAAGRFFLLVVRRREDAEEQVPA